MAANNVGNFVSSDNSSSPARKLTQRKPKVHEPEDSVMQTDEQSYSEDADMYDSPTLEQEDDSFTKDLVMIIN